MRALCGAWLVPAASLIWIGLAATEVREASEASQAVALGRTQATTILLAVFTVLIGACVFIRQLDDQRPVSHGTAPTPTVTGPSRSGARGRRSGTTRLACSHGVAAVLAVVVALTGSAAASETMAAFLVPAAAGLGFWATLVLPRVLVRLVGGWSSPLVVLAAAVGFQLTVGWLHLFNPTATLAPALIVEGLALAWVAASAARVDPFVTIAPPIPAAEIAVAADGSVAPEPAAVARTVPANPDPAGFGPRPAKPSMPEAMVSR